MGGLDFPNLPYLFDTKTGAKFTESQAIYRYIARQFKIGVQNDPQLAIADNVCGVSGNEISYADFHLYYLLFCNLKLDAKTIASFPNLKAFYDNFCNLEFMNRWNKTAYSKLPLNNTMAKFK